MLKMKELLQFLSLLAATSPPVTAVVVSLQQALLTQTNRDCNGSVIGSPLTKTFGFVEIAHSGPSEIIAVPVLIGAAPNTAYNVRVIQIKDGQAVDCGSCTSGGGTLTTNNLGVGSTYIQQAVSPGATAAWVDLNEKDQCTNFYNIAPLPIVCDDV